MQSGASRVLMLDFRCNVSTRDAPLCMTVFLLIVRLALYAGRRQHRARYLAEPNAQAVPLAVTAHGYGVAVE
jgi:hypothetical protein